MGNSSTNGGDADDDMVRCPSCGRILEPAWIAQVGMTFPGELCLWCVDGHTPGNEAGWLPTTTPNARLDTWFAYRSMIRPDRVGEDGTITLHGPPVPRILGSGVSLAIALIASAAVIIDVHDTNGWPAITSVLLFAGAMVLIGIRAWRARICIRPDRLEMRGMARSSVVKRSDTYRVGIEYRGGRGGARPYAAIQLRNGNTVIPPLTVQLPRRAVLALFDLLTAWVAEAEGQPSGEGPVSDAQRNCS